MEARTSMESASICYICYDVTEFSGQKLTDLTDYSERPIYEILESFTENKISESEIETAGICLSCKSKFNEYDEHHTIASQIQFEMMRTLRSVLRLNESSGLIYIKTEIKEEDESISHQFDEFVVDSLDQISDSEDIPVKVTKKQISVKKPPVKRPPVKKMQKSSSKDKRPRLTMRVKSIPETPEESQLEFSIVDGVKHYQCEICGKHLNSLFKYRHHKQMHSTERNFKCDVCDATFKTRECVFHHKQLHRNIFYFCDLCGSRYRDKHQLRSHMESRHLGRKDHICAYCGKAFGRDMNLRMHLQLHTKERDIVCVVCGFKTLNKTKMTRHMKSHTGERNFGCEICGKRFLYSYNVTAHIKHVHQRMKRPVTNQEKLVCKVCGQKFQKIWKAKQHMEESHKIVEVTDS